MQHRQRLSRPRAIPMHTQLRVVLAVTVSLLCLGGVAPAQGDTVSTSATVTATVLAPAPDGAGLTLSSPHLDMRGKLSDNLIIFNTSNNRRDIRITLTPSLEADSSCTLHYSPMSSSIPASGKQVLRLLVKSARPPSHCTMEHTLVITDVHDPLSPLFTVAVTTGQL